MKNKNLIVISIVFLIIIAVSLIVIMSLLLNGNFRLKKNKLFNQVSNKLVINEGYSMDFSNLEIESSAANIYVRRTGNSNVSVTIYGDEDNTSVNSNNDTLYIKSDMDPCIGICLNQQVAKIEVSLPDDYNGKIKVTDKYGDIEIDEFLNANLNIEDNCGDVVVAGGNIVEVKNDYGDIQIDKANEIIANQSCGDVKISSGNKIKVENNYGNIIIEKALEYVDLTNDCGDIEIDELNINKESFIKDNLGKIRINKTNEIFIDAITDLGKVKINNNYNNSSTKLKIKNDCGDIIVNN